MFAKEKILNVFEEHEGPLTARQTAQLALIPEGTARYELRNLVVEGFISCISRGKYMAKYEPVSDFVASGLHKPTVLRLVQDGLLTPEEITRYGIRVTEKVTYQLET